MSLSSPAEYCPRIVDPSEWDAAQRRLRSERDRADWFRNASRIDSTRAPRPLGQVQGAVAVVGGAVAVGAAGTVLLGVAMFWVLLVAALLTIVGVL
jgi:hypothetical protein